jgi:hypothetical protein
VDLSRPIRGIIPTLDAPVLEVLAGTTKPLSGREVHRLAGIGSDRGIRLVLNRLVTQGLVMADEHPAATLFVGNRRHVAWPAIEALAGLRAALLESLRERIGAWPITPIHASIFGSAARGDGDERSDIDLLLVRPEGPDFEWEQQLDSLRDWVLESTGNRCQVFDVDRATFTEHVAAADPLVDAWRREAIHLAGVSIEALVRSSRRRSASVPVARVGRRCVNAGRRRLA